MPDLLDGRTAIVTGGGSGIGRATARRFAAEGAHVVVNDLAAQRVEETVEMIRAADGIATGHVGDVTRSETVDEIVELATTQYGKLGVMFSNAGAGLAQGPLLDVSDAGWRADIELNLTAMFFCVRAALRVMVPAGGGSIICTSSAAGLGAVPGTSSYGSAKAAILALVRSAAVEYGGSGVRVNAVVPGAVGTPAFRSWVGTDDRLARYERQIPLGRLARDDDIAAAAAWLASDESRYVTGIALPVDGGGSALLAQPHLD
jgi:NAD(P)-dependent dehydrogenase (short-subunit alcohol dehydrogenase family)